MAQYVVPSTAPIKTLKEVQFGILSPVEIEAMSVGEITTAELGRRAMEAGGLMDLRQGPSDERTPCLTCDARASECPGHFAHIKLRKPVFHPGFTAVVLAVLRSVCIACGKVLGHRGRPDFQDALNPKLFSSPKARLRAVSDSCRRIPICETVVGHIGCSSRQPTYKLDGSKLTATFPPEKKSDKKSDKADEDTTAPRPAPPQQTGPRSYNAEQVYNMLKRISDEDCYVLGLDPLHARPEWMIVSVVPVAPPCVRPSTSLTGASRGHDDLTVFYSNIVKANTCLKEAEQTGDHVMDELTRLLQHYVSAMIDNNRPGQPPQSSKGRPLKALAGRIESKEGRVRNNLMGKRCDFSARTVITPDPNISIDQVGVPSSVARNLTFPEMVTNYNMQKLQELVKQGPNNYPGAKYIIRSNGHRLDLRFQRHGQAEIPLEIGDIVERHIVDGDVVIFNRQPSLHKMSMMGHRIKVFPYSTFRLNLSVTTPYNADFDGDEMNLHVPQSHETRAEIQELMMVPKNIISPQGNKPCMGIVQDTLLGCSLFTRRDTFLEKDLMMNTLMWLEGFNLDQIPIPAILKPKQLWTGKQIFSLFIPNQINLKSHSNDHDTSDRGSSPRDTIVYVSKGRLLLGILDKRTLGSSANGGLIHVITNELKSEAARHFFDSTQKVVNYWLLQHSFSVGLGDTIVSRQVQGLISEVLNRASQAVHAIVKAAQKPPEDRTKSTTTAGRSPIQVFEQQVNSELNRAISEAGKRVQKSLHRNNFKTMVSAGSKGSDLNISQIMACLAGDARVAGADGLGRRIDTLASSSIGVVVGPDVAVDSQFSTYGYYSRANNDHDRAADLDVTQATRWIERGMLRTDCVRVTLADGSSLICTPDHLLLSATGDWLQASSLKPGAQVRASALLVVDACDDDYTRKPFMPLALLDRQQSEALCRLVGALIAAGRLTEMDGGDLAASTTFAAEAIVRDIMALVPNAVTECDGDRLCFDKRVGDLLRSFGCRCGDSSLPEFLAAADLPKGLAREFLAAFFGCRSITATESRGFRIVFSANNFNTMTPTTTARLEAMLSMFGVAGEVVSNGALHLSSDAAAKFAKNINARYALDKMLHWSTWLRYYNACTRCTSQEESVGVSFQQFCERAGVPELASASSKNLPRTLCLDVVSVASVGETPLRVYDLTVPNGNAFVANGFIVHNCVGQQNVDGQRIPFGFSQRTLPHFTKDDYGQESRGFVSNSYRQGLTPQEFYFHAMGGRVGLIDTAVKTSETGYIQRRLVKALEDVRIHYDGTVRNAQGQIIQFIYGEDGIDACKLELEYLESLTISNNEFISKFKWDVMRPGFGSFLDQNVLDTVRKSTLIQTKLQNEFDQLERDRRRLRTEISPEAEKAVRVPVHLIRLIWNAQNIYKIDITKPSTMNPEHIVDEVQLLCQDLHIGGAGPDRVHATDLFRIHVRATLASLRVLRDFMLTREAFNWVIGEISTRFKASIVQPGESVGAIAAQSIGEPATQMTLNTFHLAGVATDLTVGVPRLKELINVAKQLRTPSATVRLDSSRHFDKDFANKMISNLEYTTLRKLTKVTQIWFDPCFDMQNRYTRTIIDEDQQWLDDFMELEEDPDQHCMYSSWVLRLVLDGGTVQKKRLEMHDIADHIKKQMPGEIEENGQQRSLLWVAHSQDNQVDKNGQMFLVLHVRIIIEAKDQDGGFINDDMFESLEEHLLDKVELRGDHKLRSIFYHADQDHVITKIDGTMTKQDQKPWVLGTDGVNLQHILSTEGVDPVKTTCNDINEVLDVLGIEAARGALFQEIRNVIRFAGSEVNYRHLALLADVMTFRGILAPITRFGINRSDNSPLARCSFEETVDILFEAAQFAETDPLKAVSGRIMLGQLGAFGTGSFDLLVDEAALEKVIEAPVQDWLFTKNYNDNYTIPMTPGGSHTPYSMVTPYNSPGNATPWNSAVSPGPFTPSHDYPMSPGGYSSIASPLPYQSTTSPRYSSMPIYSPVSPLSYSPQGSRGSSPSFSPASPAFSPSSPAFSPASPAFSPASPAFSPASPAFSPASPAFSPASPAFSPASPAFSPASPGFSPASPAYTRRPGTYGGASPRAYSPTSPAPYSPTSPAPYSPSSPAASSYSPASPAPYSPTSPRAYSPTSPAPYSPTSPRN